MALRIVTSTTGCGLAKSGPPQNEGLSFAKVHRSPPEQAVARVDLRSLQGPLPSDHDDDNVRVCRHAADRARHCAGAETCRSLGLAVVGGLVVSYVLTLYLTPVIYIYMDRLQQRFQRTGKTRTLPAQ